MSPARHPRTPRGKGVFLETLLTLYPRTGSRMLTSRYQAQPILVIQRS